ncbi:hypothetical protein LUZ60_001895 [Juncus effusus]|nr:hypothetical protein LUZ60_001895 [Juncus effusus]
MRHLSNPADAFSFASLSLLSLFLLLSLSSLFKTLYFSLLKPRNPQLSFFNGPWLTRLTLTLISIFWAVIEVIRTSFVKRTLFTNLPLQKIICKGYILVNLGFSEPFILFGFVFLLHASLQSKESGTLSKRWNLKTILYVLLLCGPVFILQAILVFLSPKFIKVEEQSQEIPHKERKTMDYFSKSYYLNSEEEYICTYPLFGTILLGLIDTVLILYVVYIGSKMLSSAINKNLEKRVWWIILSVLLLLVRVSLLGLSVLPKPGLFAFEMLIFLSFLVMLSCISVGILMFVYYPVTDSLALEKELELGQNSNNGISETDLIPPYDDYYSENASLIPNQSMRDLERNSEETSTKRGSISFRTMIGTDGLDETGHSNRVGFGVETGHSNQVGFGPGSLQIGSPSDSSPSSVSRPMLPLREIPRY